MCRTFVEIGFTRTFLDMIIYPGLVPSLINLASPDISTYLGEIRTGIVQIVLKSLEKVKKFRAPYDLVQTLARKYHLAQLENES